MLESVVKKLTLKDLRNQNKSFLGFFKESLTSDALIATFDNFPKDNKTNILKIIFSNQLAYFEIDEVKIPSLLKIKNQYYLSAPYLVYVFSLFFKTPEEFVVENRLAPKGDILDYAGLKKLLSFDKALEKNILMNREEMTFKGVEYQDKIFKMPLLEIKKDFVNENAIALSLKIGNANEVALTKVKRRANFGIFCEEKK